MMKCCGEFHFNYAFAGTNTMKNKHAAFKFHAFNFENL